VPNTVVFLWISAAGVLPGVAGPSPDLPGVAGLTPRSVHDGRGGAGLGRAAADLRDLGAARGVSFVPVPAARPYGLPANDAALVDSLEAELEQARTALSALEEASASTRLHKVQAELLAHPHLPQAAFLMAECLALQAQAARPQNPGEAAALELQRLALEGPRAAAFGESAVALPASASITLALQGLRAADELELDGARLAAGVTRVALAPGLHHLRVWRAGEPIFATFSQLTSEQTTLVLAVPPLVPCSAEDLRRVPRTLDEPASLPPGIECARWARVQETGVGIAVSWCSHSQCGAYLPWQERPVAPFTPIAVEAQRFPAWVGFAIAGASALLASSVVLWQAGAFERGRPAAATWEYGGLNPQGSRF